ncbi:hypothetical protein AXA84_0111 [Candidatus Phytoplasma oryzae]|uniref:Uncharacterized protein n=1 Tax=Candidatus Phytoplasma oryzae TaxID=203274 RepID=A0A139JR74_9MOLU|nr:hypothetical protein [Candidatus Phytoplasma oryzae]KXT29465.1 hypothetical protein AXA84_0111 [Candidatus Phytoplasma oryzae]
MPKIVLGCLDSSKISFSVCGKIIFLLLLYKVSSISKKNILLFIAQNLLL